MQASTHHEILNCVCSLQPSAMYNVTLLFCELYFTDPSARRFNVTFNSQQTLLSNFSIYEAAGMPEARMP